MDAAIVADTTRQILDAEPPARLLKRADALWLQSSTSIPLKPNLEPARIHICCVLAVEQLSQQLGLPAPNMRKPPVTPAVYTRLLDQFRQTLLGLPPPKAPPAASDPGSGARRHLRPARQRRALRHSALSSPDKQSTGRAGVVDQDASEGAASDVETAAQAAGGDAADDDAYSDSNSSGREDAHGDNEDDAFGAPRTPRKRAPATARKGSPTPKKASPRKRAKSSAPTPHVIDQMGERMELASETTKAVQHAFAQYCDLVKDAWGLLYGLFAVISERAEPRMGMENLNRLDRALREIGPPRLYVDPNEWVPWVERIVTGQTWITNISKKPEPTPKLVGAPGGWGLGVEFALVDQ